MKRLFIALSLTMAVTALYAQPKTAAEAQKNLDKAIAATQDPKKADKPATWIALGDAYVAAYEQPTRNILIGTPQQEIKLLIKEQQVLKSETKRCNGTNYLVDSYADKDLYYNENGALDFYVITKPAVEGEILVEAQNAYEKAYALDTKATKAKDLNARLTKTHDLLVNEALAYYFTNNYAPSAKNFVQAVKCSESPALNHLDTMNCYHAALVSGFAGDNETAIKFYNKCIDMKYYQDGNVFSNLSNIYMASGDTITGKKVLEDGFAKYPQSQGVLVGLINLYRTTNENPNKLFDLLHTAQANEPNNASLFYVEGDIYKNLGDRENAEKLFYRATEIDPTYVFGVLSVGIMYYDYAVEIQTKASEEMNDAKWQELNEKFEETLEKAIVPFEKSFNMTEDMEIKKAVAEYLKNIFFRFRNKSDEYMASYNKYNDFLKEN